MHPRVEANCNYTGLMKLPEKAVCKKHTRIKRRKKKKQTRKNQKTKPECFTFLKLCFTLGNSRRSGHELFTSLIYAL